MAAGPIVRDFVELFWPGSPVIAWIAAAIVFLSAASGALARIAALPQVDALLARIGLGSAPHVGDDPIT